MNDQFHLPPLPAQTDGMAWHQMPALPGLWTALRRGLSGCCPVCGGPHLFTRYLKVCPQCPRCQTRLGQVPADDAPPYFTILVVGHIVVPLLLMVEMNFKPALWLEAAIFLPLTALLALGLLQPIKGATVALLLHHDYANSPAVRHD